MSWLAASALFVIVLAVGWFLTMTKGGAVRPCPHCGRDMVEEGSNPMMAESRVDARGNQYWAGWRCGHCGGFIEWDDF